MDDTKHSLYNPVSMVARDNNEAASLSQSDSDSAGEDQNGARKRKRPMNVTCEACKLRKVKCDRVQPACGWCARNDHVCEYKERKKPGLRAGYGRELESRLDKLESMIEDQARQLASHLQQSCSINETAATGMPTATSRPSNTQGFNSDANQFNLDPTLQAGMVDPKLHSPVSRHHSLQYTSNATPAGDIVQNQVYHTPSSHSHALASPHSTAAFQYTNTSHHEPSAPLPPYDLLYALVDLYFRHVNVWLPLLDRKTTLDALFGRAPLEEADRVLLHAMVAVSLRFSDDPRLTNERRNQYHTTSKQKVQLFGLENTSVRSLQALVVLALDVTGTTNGPPGWNLLSVISRSVIQLGLGAESTSSLNAPMYPSIATLRAAQLPEPKSFVEDEERRRLFWSVYLLDRYTTVATAFEFALDEKEVDRRLPCRDDIFAANKPVETRWFGSGRARYADSVTATHGHFAYHCELLGILGRIHQFLKRPIDIGSLADVEQWQASYRSLDSELNTWHFSLPDEFVNITGMMKTGSSAKPVNCGWIMLHAAYYLTAIRLNSSAAYPAQSSHIFSSSYSAMQRCMSASDSMKQLCHLVKISGLLDRVGPPFAFAAWVSARVMLVHGSTKDFEIDPDIAFFVSLLAEMGQHWDVAQRYSDILNRVLEEYKTSQRAGSSGRVTPSTVKILADMRRCAYDLDFLISRQPNSAIKSYHPTRANTPAPHELEYLDVFDIFNFPRMPMVVETNDGAQGPGSGLGPSTDLNTLGGAMTMPNFAVPDPDTDWLFHAA